jgi:phosphotransferase system HPr-like phosphotransfer protein
MTRKEFFSQTINQDQVTQAVSPILMQMVLSGKILGNPNYVGNVFTGIKNKQEISYISSSSPVKAYTDAFSSSDSMTIDKRTLQPGKFKINEQFGSSELEVLFQNSSLSAGVGNVMGLGALEGAIVDHLTKQLSKQLDKIMFQSTGNTSANTAYSEITGLMTRGVADNSTVKVSANTLTKSNVLDEIEKVYNAISDDAKDGEVKIFVSEKTYGFYKQALAGLGLFNGVQSTDPSVIGTSLYYDSRVEIVPTVGMANNKMFATAKENLFVGLDTELDYTNLRFIDLRNTTGDNYLRIVGDFSIDINYGDSTAVVIYN